MFDSTGHGLARPIHWALADTAIAALNDTNGDHVFVTGRLAGTEPVIASSEGIADTAIIQVIRQSVAEVRLLGDTSRLLHQSIRFVRANAVDSVGNILDGRKILWSSTDSTTVLADSVFTSAGLSLARIQGTGVGTATVAATSEGESATWNATVYAVHYDAIAVGANQGCALASDDTLTYCWGALSSPLPLAGAPRLSSITEGEQHGCGVTATGVGYCWGADFSGQLGDGGSGFSDSAQLVAGGHAFQTIDAGKQHTCAVTTANVALCWGDNSTGQLGNGDTVRQSIPVAVAGGMTFTMVSAGDGFSCGIATGETFCWGTNGSGQLGVGAVGNPFTTPQAVTTAVALTSVTAGGGHACGLTGGGEAYCWGANGSGQLGTNDTIMHTTPTPVVGGLTFKSIAAGTTFSCGVTTTGTAYCWGANNTYQLGNGGQINSKVPVPVSGAYSFETVSTSQGAACAVGASGAYCWGLGPLGSFTDESSIPIPVWGNP